MRFDLWQTERERAEVETETRLRILRGEFTKPTDGKTYPTLMIWRPKATKPHVNVYLRTAERRDEIIAREIENAKQHAETVAKYKAERKGTPEAVEAVKPGTIFYSSWGYDQTNIDYYEVTERRGRYVTIRQIGRKVIEQGPQDKTWPDYGRFVGPAQRKLLQFGARGSEPYLTIASYASAWLWDGRSRSATAAGWGH